MKSFSQFYAEAVVLAKKGGVQGKLDKATNTFTKGAWSDTESARYQKYSKPAAPKSDTGVSGVSKPAAPKPAAAARPPAPRSAAQKNADNLRLGAELGGVARRAAQQKYSNQNSLVAQGAAAAAKREPAWKKASKGLKDRDYGIPDFVSDRRRNNQTTMADANRDAGMSSKDAETKATRDEKELNKKNMQYMKNRRSGYQPGSGY